MMKIMFLKVWGRGDYFRVDHRVLTVGGISHACEILKNIVKALDTLWIFDFPTGITPLLILDCHVNRVELPFLYYINDPLYLWRALIGVQYGTSLWQVGDST